MSNSAALSMHWEQFASVEAMPETYRLFLSQAHDIAVQSEASVRPAVEAMADVSGYAELDMVHITTKPLSAWSIAGAALARRVRGDESASFAWSHHAGRDIGIDASYESTDLALREGQTGVFYSSRKKNDQIVSTGLTVFQNIAREDLPADSSMVSSFGAALNAARASGNFWNADERTGLVIPAIHADVSVKEIEDWQLMIRRPLPARLDLHMRHGLSKKDVDAMTDAVQTMGAVAAGVVSKVQQEQDFRSRHPRLSRRMSG
jgi:hypothetical protein